MKISRLHAENVHGYLPIDISFFDDLTFLTGLNGCGKTSSLRLLMAMLAPNLDELASITFSKAAVTIREADREVVVRAERTPDHICLSVEGLEDVLTISIAELEVYAESRRREELRSPFRSKFQQHPVLLRLKAISTPMFLGLDRRFYSPDSDDDEVGELRRRQYYMKRLTQDETNTRGVAITSLADVNYLVVTRMQEVRAAQEHLDDELREQFLTKAFEYKPADFNTAPTSMPTTYQVDNYRRQLSTLSHAAAGIKIPVPTIQAALTKFFDKMTAIVESLAVSSSSSSNSKTVNNAYFEWIINKPQADRIIEHLKMLDEYIEKRHALRDPIIKFVALVNTFLTQTGKEVLVTSNGELAVKVHGRPEARHITALSSGERQLLIMLGHLSLNPSLAVSGVFIVDEPELSLHIDWQERFVDAIQSANPNVQLILATHSPAIILDRVDNCKTLSEGQHA